MRKMMIATNMMQTFTMFSRWYCFQFKALNSTVKSHRNRPTTTIIAPKGMLTKWPRTNPMKSRMMPASSISFKYFLIMT